MMLVSHAKMSLWVRHSMLGGCSSPNSPRTSTSMDRPSISFFIWDHINIPFESSHTKISVFDFNNQIIYGWFWMRRSYNETVNLGWPNSRM